MDKEFIFREVLNMIQGLDCYFNHHQLHEFFMDENMREFRLMGKYGYGFKIYRYYPLEYLEHKEVFKFGQYPEDETKESQEWIEKHNALLFEMCR